MTTKAMQDVLAERKRQIDKEGWTPGHDDDHTNGELEDAAMCYLIHTGSGFPPSLWPWEANSWKPKNSRENFVRAAALRLAERQRHERNVTRAQELYEIAVNMIERLDRLHADQRENK